MLLFGNETDKTINLSLSIQPLQAVPLMEKHKLFLTVALENLLRKFIERKSFESKIGNKWTKKHKDKQIRIGNLSYPELAKVKPLKTEFSVLT